MLVKKVKYEDLNGDTVEEEFLFHIAKHEALELKELGFDGDKEGLEAKIERLTKTEDAQEAWGIFKKLLLMSYGVKSPDGKQFWKKDSHGRPMADYLEASPALSEIIFEMISNPEEAGKFFERALPKNFVEEAKRNQEAERGANPGAAVEPPEKTFGDYSREELLDMPEDQFVALIGPNAMRWTSEQLSIAMERKNQQ